MRNLGLEPAAPQSAYAGMSTTEFVDLKLSEYSSTKQEEAKIQISAQNSEVDSNSNASEQPTTLYHYTDEKGLNGILETNKLNPSLKSVNPKDARYGDGQYLTNIVPGSKTPNQLSRELVNNPFQGNKFTHFIEIKTNGLIVLEGRPGVFVIPNTEPLILSNRIVNYGVCKR
jgi:large repetitive protein